jgi:hypothetical protein
MNHMQTGNVPVSLLFENCGEYRPDHAELPVLRTLVFEQRAIECISDLTVNDGIHFWNPLDCVVLTVIIIASKPTLFVKDFREKMI